MGHNSSKHWIDGLSEPQKKYLLKKHGGFCQLSVRSFSNNEKDSLMKTYQMDPTFNSLTQGPADRNIRNDGPGDWQFLD